LASEWEHNHLRQTDEHIRAAKSYIYDQERLLPAEGKNTDTAHEYAHCNLTLRTHFSGVGSMSALAHFADSSRTSRALKQILKMLNVEACYRPTATTVHRQ
jgi:hypothetical protein